MGDVLVRTGHFVLGKGGSAPRAPRHRLVFTLNPAVIVTDLQEMPDSLDILVGVGVIGVVPLHPLTEPLRLVGDDAGEMLDTVNALLREVVHTVIFDVLFRLEAELFFNLNFYPETLRVKAVLTAAVVASHVFITDKGILERSAPCMVDTHRIISGNRAVNKTETLVTSVLFLAQIEAVVIFPKLQHIMLHFNEAVAFLIFSHYIFLRESFLQIYRYIILYRFFICKKIRAKK